MHPTEDLHKMNKTKNRKINDFFSKKLKVIHDVVDTIIVDKSEAKTDITNENYLLAGTSDNKDIEATAINHSEQSNDTNDNSGTWKVSGNLLDIGSYVGNNIKNVMTEELKFSLLKNTWSPPESYKFPVGERNLRFQRSWLIEFPWLAYSEVKEGAYCRVCVLFLNLCESVGKGDHQCLGALVVKPHQRWKKAKEEFRRHEGTGYHKKCVQYSLGFLAVQENRVESIDKQLDSTKKAQIEENRKRLTPIIKTVILCGRQGIALRGHDDSGPLLLDEPSANDGNFRALLRYRIDGGDEILKTHIKYSTSNATYLSPQIQNSIIEACEKIIKSELVNRVNKAGYFSVLADETTDIQGIEQFSLCVRYVHKNVINSEFTICEDFLMFVPIHDLTGRALAKTMLESLQQMGLDLRYMRGQGYDGAAAMSGRFNGCQAVVQEQYPTALYVHCANHSLNLALTHSCTVPQIRNCLGTVKEIITFFRCSAKRETVLKKKIHDINENTKRTRLLKFCETRWVEHHDSLFLFNDLYDAILQALYEIQNFIDADASSKAYRYQAAMENGSFIIALIVTCQVFGLTYNLSKSLQSKECDLSNCVSQAEDLACEIQSLRAQADIKFNGLFREAVERSQRNGFTIVLPRKVGTQVNRDNYSTNDPETFYRQSIYITFLDFVAIQINQRFTKHKTVIKKIQVVLPKICVNLSDKEMEEGINVLVEHWYEDIDRPLPIIHGEFTLWKRKWANTDLSERELGFIETLNKCDMCLFPTIHKILKIAASLPVSVASSERSFSTLRRLKTYLRNTVCQPRLNGLALLNIHRDLEVSVEKILDLLSTSPRRLRLTV